MRSMFVRRMDFTLWISVAPICRARVQPGYPAGSDTVTYRYSY